MIGEVEKLRAEFQSHRAPQGFERKGAKQGQIPIGVIDMAFYPIRMPTSKFATEPLSLCYDMPAISLDSP
jgi:hypothetical protein